MMAQRGTTISGGSICSGGESMRSSTTCPAATASTRRPNVRPNGRSSIQRSTLPSGPGNVDGSRAPVEIGVDTSDTTDPAPAGSAIAAGA